MNSHHYIDKYFSTFFTTIPNLSSNASSVAKPICGNNIVFGTDNKGSRWSHFG